MPQLIRSVALDGSVHSVDQFDCGQLDLTAWLVNSAGSAQQSGTANTFVWTRGGDVLAYYSLAAHQVIRDMLPAGMARGALQVIPAYIIGKLALDVSLRGRGRGSSLLFDAIARCVDAAEEGVAAKLIVVDAIDTTAADIYAANGLVPSSSDPHRLYMKMSTARKTIAKVLSNRGRSDT